LTSLGLGSKTSCSAACFSQLSSGHRRERILLLYWVFRVPRINLCESGQAWIQLVISYRIDIVKKNIEISIYPYRFDIVSISAKRRRCCLFIFFL